MGGMGLVAPSTLFALTFHPYLRLKKTDNFLGLLYANIFFRFNHLPQQLCIPNFAPDQAQEGTTQFFTSHAKKMPTANQPERISWLSLVASKNMGCMQFIHATCYTNVFHMKMEGYT